MADLPLEVRDAIRRALGRSTDQVRKAERDAHTLYRKYGLPPDKWNSLAFHRMALDIGWARSTEAHRWAIFKGLSMLSAFPPVPFPPLAVR